MANKVLLAQPGRRATVVYKGPLESLLLAPVTPRVITVNFYTSLKTRLSPAALILLLLIPRVRLRLLFLL